MAKKRIVVMYGGKADEHSISCISAASALRALDTDKFEAIPVGITKDGKWIVNGENPLGWSLDEGLPTVEKTPGAKGVVPQLSNHLSRFLRKGTQSASTRPTKFSNLCFQSSKVLFSIVTISITDIFIFVNTPFFFTGANI